MSYKSNDRLEPENSIHFTEHDTCKLESNSAATYCHGEEETSTMTTVTAKPEPAPRKTIDTSSSHVAQTSRNFIQPQVGSSLARQKPVTLKMNASYFTKLPKETNHCDNLIHVTNETQKRLDGRIRSSREETYEVSSGTDDTEDSTDKDSKPKPGRLDLRQFDNITNAIGKLNVQTKKIGEPESLTQSKHQSAQDVSSEFCYFKYRSKKVKSRAKDSSSKDESSVDEKSVISEKAKKSAKQSVIESRLSNIADTISGFQGSPAKDIETCDIILKPEPSRSETEKLTRTPTFFGPSKSSLCNNEVPRPVPRSSQSVSCVTSKAQILSMAPSSAVTKTSPPSISSVNTGKRFTNLRQNHGRAVAPPQLPGDHLSGATSTIGSESDAADIVEEKSINHQSIRAEEHGADLSQSPIAQRLLKFPKDYKVSELNSPSESDNEQGPAISSSRNSRFHRGPSLKSGMDSPQILFPNASIDSSELIIAKEAAIKQLNEILSNKQPLGRFAGSRQPPSRGSSFNLEQEPQNSTEFNRKKDKETKQDRKKLRDDEKSEKKRQKEEERLRRQEKKLAAKKSKSDNASENIDDDGIPLFIRKCIEFIEYEGLVAEGIYRVPGNRAHVDAFFQTFKENPNMSIMESDIPVNAVATALKDFLSKKWVPIIPPDSMNELIALSNISDKYNRVDAIRQLVKKLPLPNYNLLKYVFSHFVKVSLNHSLNSMDSKNLAICWWPTLLPLHFSDMFMFEQMRPHLEESIQTMIDQYDYIFDDEGSPASRNNP